ncbi:unnamed protein product [Darwinula stevensoni]|uniref:Ecdysoneless n=1 Tax=Darwinula stevensoni TaxID=69355 RepID=A0A7R9AA23_9CRUS|nr:unnamed protein product [Darwinula stevensoni]CAG0897993.1 unnamed protein product [Darwinula stevensoni]
MASRKVTRLPRVPEESVAYDVFYRLSSEEASSSDPPHQEIISTLVSNVAHHLLAYIWHKEPFSLRPHPSTPYVDEEDGNPPAWAWLIGETSFGENVEDEWFIVWLLLQLTEAFSPDLIARVRDSDGEFLLVEAAEHLPEWLDPNSARNRVFLHGGGLHVIGAGRDPGWVSPIPSGVPSLSDALHLVRRLPHLTRAPSPVQRDVRGRIRGYPGRMEESVHRVNVRVPVVLAGMLEREPWLVSPAVHAFHHRDPIDVKALRAMKFFPPETCVTTRVTFTRCLYAMLSSGKYEPDHRTGWKFPLPPSSAEYKSAVLGMKLACGFEILAVEAERASKSESNGVASASLDDDPKWKEFLKSLEDKGYFQGEVEGSQKQKALMSSAREYYQRHVRDCDVESSRGDFRRRAGKRILELCRSKSLDVDLEEAERRAQSLPPSDDDSWLDLTPESLEALLLRLRPEDPEIADSLRLFLDRSSSFEGVDLPKSESRGGSRKTSRNERRKKSSTASWDRKISTASTLSNLSDRIAFDPEKMNAALSHFLDLDLGNEEETSGSEDSDMSGLMSEEEEEECPIPSSVLEGIPETDADIDASLLKSVVDEAGYPGPGASVLASLRRFPNPSVM